MKYHRTNEKSQRPGNSTDRESLGKISAIFRNDFGTVDSVSHVSALYSGLYVYITSY